MRLMRRTSDRPRGDRARAERWRPRGAMAPARSDGARATRCRGQHAVGSMPGAACAMRLYRPDLAFNIIRIRIWPLSKIQM